MSDRSKKRPGAKKPAVSKRRQPARPVKRPGLYDLAWIQFRALRWL